MVSKFRFEFLCGQSQLIGVFHWLFEFWVDFGRKKFKLLNELKQVHMAWITVHGIGVKEVSNYSSVSCNYKATRTRTHVRFYLGACWKVYGVNILKVLTSNFHKFILETTPFVSKC
jgi:hypothetical protein